MAQPFDSASLQLSGEPFVVAEQVGFTSTRPQIAASASRTGTIALLANGRPERQLVWYDRSGKQLGRAADTSQGGAVSLAPDGKRVAFRRIDAQNVSEGRLLDLERSQETRLFAPLLAPAVVWSPDAVRVSFVGRVAGTVGIYVRNVSGGKEDLLLRDAGSRLSPSDWSRDGRWIVYTENDPKTLGDIWLLPAPSNAPAGKAAPLVRTSANESQGQISPDGRWLAYVSQEAGTDSQVYLRSFAGTAQTSDATWQVSATNGQEPRWQADGRELFYIERVLGTQRFKLLAVPIRAASTPAGAPKTLFEFETGTQVLQDNAFTYSPSPDGQRFLINVYATELQPSLDVLLNWPASLRRGQSDNR